MAATIDLITVEEFRNHPKDSGPVCHELRHGHIVPVTRPKYQHYSIQRRLRSLLEPLTPAGGLVDTEFAFRPLPEHELRVADVAYPFGQEISLPLFSGAKLAVDDIFS